MKTKAILFTFSLVALTFSSGKINAQVNAEVSPAEQHRTDSVQTLHDAEQFQTQKTKDENRMTDVRRERKLAKAKAKEAQRVGREANDAARESNNAFKAEKQAQKARRKADKQAEKASNSREKSELNSN